MNNCKYCGATSQGHKCSYCGNLIDEIKDLQGTVYMTCSVVNYSCIGASQSMYKDWLI